MNRDYYTCVHIHAYINMHTTHTQQKQSVLLEESQEHWSFLVRPAPSQPPTLDGDFQSGTFIGVYSAG